MPQFTSEDGKITGDVAAFQSALQERFNEGLHVSGVKVISLGAQTVNGQIIEWSDSSLTTTDKKGGSPQKRWLLSGCMDEEQTRRIANHA